MKNKLLRCLPVMALLTMSVGLAAPASAQEGLVDLLPVELNDYISGSAKQSLGRFGASTEPVAESPNGIYVVQMIGDPVIAYEGGIKGLKATKPSKGKKIDPNSPHVVNYVDYLNARHAAALNKAGGGQKVYDYNYSFNGFSAKLSHGQAQKLQSVEGVVAVHADELLFLDTATTPHFIGLDSDGGLWEQLGGVGSSGEDIIIGIVDGGIWPESLSFTDRTGTNGNVSKDGKLNYHQIPGWHGKCTPGEAFNASHCNQKLIGAQYYNAAWGGNAGIDANLPWEFNSPRDFGGHGTHTASTAGGNHNTPLTGLAEVLGTVSGIAPRARIAVYKTCWETGTGGSCFSSDSIAAIDQAVADGVDVINYSISGSRTNFLNGVEVAFLFAADAGVFVAASAGNSGPPASTVAHPGPWLTTVAATTHDRYFEADLALGNGATYTGASTNSTGAGSADLVYSANVLDPAYVHDPEAFDNEILTAAEAARLCVPGSLDAASVAGKIVLCDRGIIARVDKSRAVFMAGGVGSFLANANAGDSLNADFHSVPTVHVDKASGDAIRTYALTDPTPTAEIMPSYFAPVSAPFIAGFSSRGPLLAGNGDLLKPDVAAPGQAVLAAVAPPGNGGADFAQYSGTSMSSPHVAGLGALLKDLHPDWSPMAIKSALMTTGTNLLSGADPFAQGAGFVNPTGAADPGLVYDHGFSDWLDFLFGPEPSNLNGASIAIGILPGSQTVTRTVTNVGDSPETYQFSYDLAGVDVTANPDSFTVNPGESQTFELTFTANQAPFNAYATGFVYWTGDGGHVVRSPVAVRPTALLAPAVVEGVVDGNGDGSVDVPVDFFYTGTYNAMLEGFADEFPFVSNNVNDSDDTQDIFCFGLGIPLTHLRVATHDADTTTPGQDDLDLRLFYHPSACTTSGIVQLGSSAGFTSEEVIDVPNSDPGVYLVVVDYFDSPTGSIDYTINLNLVLGDDGNGSVSSAPLSAIDGTSDIVTVDYNGLNLGGYYLGVLKHENADGEVGRTLIDVTTQ